MSQATRLRIYRFDPGAVFEGGRRQCSRRRWRGAAESVADEPSPAGALAEVGPRLQAAAGSG